jgi:hypothetical protein
MKLVLKVMGRITKKLLYERKIWLGLLYTLRTPEYYNYLKIENTIFQEFGLGG